ncbi:hypothetical protein OHU11_07125 [Streptomyces sp. NBC_00257]|uniref:hypothetical protein n=1 Tax=unclassified Streptomyces TaxID=2593676 RepID=UPI00225AFE36|nr:MULTISPECIES: hypothetical protein [unclassified Streptomyces]WSW03932.1 hypothetical protein OG298_06090 [Streptomyces sp. NBC_01005]WTB58493.1 hypothetical protein OG832_37700 [Streptomyces sp. NBC_00826]WTC93437.1 hypothetical protein OH736_06090 [Streptomyces sp. NBC_01650]WTH88627.1 hypothetical protein OIC43_06005 [Streptomyces sp. NBC_00825]WTH97357.1 hypothetical protein OHA23_06010 [Streptomyces sp. NBC_00822]
MGFDGYRIKSGMTGQARQLDDAGTDMDGVSSAVKSRTTYSYDDAGGDDAASALNAFVKAWEAEAKTLAGALHELGGKVQLAKKTYHGTDGLVRTGVDSVHVGGTSVLTDTSTQGGRTSVLSGY